MAWVQVASSKLLNSRMYPARADALILSQLLSWLFYTPYFNFYSFTRLVGMGFLVFLLLFLSITHYMSVSLPLNNNYKSD